MNDESNDLTQELEEFLAAERDIPPVSHEQGARIYDRLRATLGLPGGGGLAGGAGVSGAVLGGLLAILIGSGTVAFFVVRAFVAPDTHGELSGHRGGPVAEDDGHPAAHRPGGDGAKGGATVPPRLIVPRRPSAEGESPGGSVVSHAEPASEGDGAAEPARPGWFGQRGVEPRRIAGRVLDGDRPTAGAEVSLESILSAADPAFERRVQTGPDGAFDLGPQPGWTYLVSASAPGRRPAVARVVLNDPDAAPAAEKLVLKLERCEVVVEGTVTDESGRGVGGARVRRLENWYNGPLAYAGSLERGAPGETYPDGRFALCAGAGTIKLRVEADGYGSRIVAIQAVAPRTRADVMLLPEGAIEGVVVRAETGAPIPHAQLALWPNGQSASPMDVVPTTALSDASGRFQVRGLAPSRYWLNAWAPDALARERHEVTVRPGQVKRGVVRRLHTTTTVEARVLERGIPVVGVRIGLRLDGTEDDSSYGAFTQADGRVTIHGVLAGRNVLALPGYRVLTPAIVDVQDKPVTGLTVEVEREAPARIEE